MDMQEGKEKMAECLFKEIIADNFPNLGTEWDIQVQEANRLLYFNLSAKNPSLGHMITKLSRIKDREFQKQSEIKRL